MRVLDSNPFGDEFVFLIQPSRYCIVESMNIFLLTVQDILRQDHGCKWTEKVVKIKEEVSCYIYVTFSDNVYKKI